ncbi:DUF2231 domain-containing protein [Poriferisphaera sp. WC338]|uniref:DUF2231 domain-containing protein n=1 Tax=Poriferisphaera sp. WC338 TaxID=3425129 RepID=UPI003D81BFFE
MTRHNFIILIITLFALSLAPFLVGQSTSQAPSNNNATNKTSTHKQAAPPTHLTNDQLAEQLHQILLVHCGLCHGPNADPPAAGLNFLTDINRIRTYTAFIVPGKPDDSPMFTVANSDEMPPATSNIPPLNAKEKQLFKQWIIAGAPPLTSKKLSQKEAQAKHDHLGSPAAKHKPIPTTHRLAEFFGQFHPPSTHFPIALIFIAAFAELLLIITRKSVLASITRFTLWCGTITAILALALGLLDAYTSIFSPARYWILNTHRALAIATTSLSIIALLILELHTIKKTKPPHLTHRIFLRIILFTTAVLVCVTGFFGGALVFGIDHYIW